MKKGWEIIKLGEVCERASSNVSQNQLSNDEGAYPIFGASGLIKNVSFYHQENPYLSIVKDGSGVGRVTKMDARTSIIGTLQYILPKENVDLDYLFYSLISIDFKKYVAGAAIPHIYFKDYKDEPFLWMPLSEQKRIVQILNDAFEKVDTLKSNAERNLQNAKELFESALTDELKPRKGWEEKKLGELATFRNGMNFTRTGKGDVIQIVGVKDFQKSFWVPFDTLETVTLDGKLNEIDLLKENDILAVRSNGNPALIGRTLLSGKVNGNISHSGFTIRIRLDSSVISPIYLCHYLKTQKTRKELVDSGNGVGIKSLNQGSLSSLSIPFPKSLIEQQTIVQKLEVLSSNCQSLVTNYQKTIVQCEDMKKAILAKAFNGEL